MIREQLYDHLNKYRQSIWQNLPIHDENTKLDANFST